MKLLRELVTETTHTVDAEKNLYLSGIAVMCEEENQNGRIYKTDIMAPEINRYIKESIQANRAYGEADHPQSCEISIDRIGVLWTECTQDGNLFHGKCKVLPTAPGNTINAIVSHGGVVGFSTRGLGDVITESSGKSIVSNYRMITLGDVVVNPSVGSRALAISIMESTEWMLDANGKYIPMQETIETAKKELSKASLNQFDEVAMRQYIKFISLCRG